MSPTRHRPSDKPKSFVQYVFGAIGSLVVLVIAIMGRHYMRYGDFNVIRSDRTIETASMNITYSFDWINRDTEDADWCEGTNENWTCLAYFANRRPGFLAGAWVGIGEYVIDPAMGLTLQQRASNAWNEYLVAFPCITQVSQTESRIDGVPAIAVEFYYAEESGLRAYERRIYLLRTPAHFVVIGASADTDDAFNNNLGEIEELISGIDLKTG